MSENPNYYAIIPANVRYADITPNAKLLYGEITALSNKTGICFASNSYFADLYKVSEISISKWISELVKNGFINREIIYKDGTKEILNRYLRILIDPIKENFNTSQRKVKYPIKEKFKDNNTSLIIHNNNTSINIPTFEVFKMFALEHKNVSLHELELKYKSWVAGNWHDGNGKKIKNWKTKLLNTLPFLSESKENKNTKGSINNNNF